MLIPGTVATPSEEPLTDVLSATASSTAATPLCRAGDPPCSQLPPMLRVFCTSLVCSAAVARAQVTPGRSRQHNSCARGSLTDSMCALVHALFLQLPSTCGQQVWSLSPVMFALTLGRSLKWKPPRIRRRDK